MFNRKILKCDFESENRVFNEYSPALFYMKYAVDKDLMIKYHTIPANEIPISTISAVLCMSV